MGQLALSLMRITCAWELSDYLCVSNSNLVVHSVVNFSMIDDAVCDSEMFQTSVCFFLYMLSLIHI